MYSVALPVWRCSVAKEQNAWRTVPTRTHKKDGGCRGGMAVNECIDEWCSCSEKEKLIASRMVLRESADCSQRE